MKLRTFLAPTPLVVICTFLAPTPLVINEVFYDPLGSDRGFEFVEIVNISGDDVCLGGWRFETGNGAYEDRWKLEWTGEQGDTLRAGEFFVVGESQVFPEPDVICDLDLQNGPDACRLVGPNGQMDVVGWGQLEFDTYFEGSPAAGVAAGHSIGREPDGKDTDCNEADFTDLAKPSPGDYNHPPLDLALMKACLSRYSTQRGNFIDLVCLIANRGLYAFGEGTPIFGQFDEFQGSSIISEDIEPGCEDRYVIRMPNPGEGFFTCRLWLENREDLVSSNDSLNMTFVIKPSPVVINEILFCPSGMDCEWIELLCRKDGIDIAGWTLEDSHHQPITIVDQSYPLRRGDMVVLVEDKQIFEAKHPNFSPGKAIHPIGGWHSLNDNDGPLGFADEIVIRDPYGTTIDSIAYCRDWCECGLSLERIDPVSSSTDAGNWSPHYGEDVGSPGTTNSVSILLPESHGVLKLAPSVITPNGDGKDDILGIRIDLPQACNVDLNIYDVRGIPIITLLSGNQIEAGRTTLWNGLNSEGEPAHTGIYLVVLRAKSNRNGTTYEAKAPVIVIQR